MHFKMYNAVAKLWNPNVSTQSKRGSLPTWTSTTERSRRYKLIILEVITRTCCFAVVLTFPEVFGRIPDTEVQLLLPYKYFLLWPIISEFRESSCQKHKGLYN